VGSLSAPSGAAQECLDALAREAPGAPDPDRNQLVSSNEPLNCARRDVQPARDPVYIQECRWLDRELEPVRYLLLQGFPNHVLDPLGACFSHHRRHQAPKQRAVLRAQPTEYPAIPGEHRIMPEEADKQVFQCSDIAAVICVRFVHGSTW